MAATSDDSDDETFVVVGTPLPPLEEGEGLKKPTTIQDLTARDKQGRRRFHGAFTGGFSAGYFNSVGSKEGFTPSSFVSSRSQKRDAAFSTQPENFMDDEDLEEHGIAPRKFSTVGDFTSEERKRKFHDDVQKVTGSTVGDIGTALSELIVPENLTIGIKLLRKMGWKEGQGLGPRVRKKKRKEKKAVSQAKMYGCALPPSGDSDSADSDIPTTLQDVTFAPKDQTPIALTPKDDMHGLGYRGLDPSLALPGSHTVGRSAPVKKSKYGKGIQGQAFGVGAFEDEDDDIYAQDNMSNYDLTLTEGDEKGDNLFGWTAPRSHGKQPVPVSYVGKLLDGFCLSSKPFVLKKKFPPPTLPKDFKPVHWFRRKNKEDAAKEPEKLSAVDRGLLLGEKPIIGSVFDLVNRADKARISSTKEAIEMTQSLKHASTSKEDSSSKEDKERQKKETSITESQPAVHTVAHKTFLSKFTPSTNESTDQKQNAEPLFQGSMGFQPFRKDAAKQARYDKYLASVKQGVSDPYSQLTTNPLTEWEKSRERDEFSMAAKLFRPMSAMMSARFVQRSVIDDTLEEDPPEEETEKPDYVKAAEMKMFGKLTREEHEWHPDKLVCKRFNVPNPYPGSDIIGLPTVKRDKFSVFNFLNFGDYQPGERQGLPPGKVSKSEKEPPKTKELKAITPAQKKAKMASIFSVLDDPDFHKPQTSSSSKKDGDTEVDVKSEEAKEGESAKEESLEEPDVDLFRAIFKNSDSEDSDDSSKGATDKDKESDEDVGIKSEGEDGSRSGTDISADNHRLSSAQENKNHVELEKSLSVSETRKAGDSIEMMSNPFASVFRDSKNMNRSSASKKQKSVFSALEELSDNEKEKEMDVQDSDDNSEMFGPSLPPPVDIHVSTSTDSSFISQAFHSHKDRKERQNKDERREKNYEQVKEKSKSKKSKKKKSKLKKKEKKNKKHKKKSSKHKSKRPDTDSSGSDADSESSDDQ